LSIKKYLRIDSDLPTLYQIRIKGHLGCEWSGWFEGMVIKLEENGDTFLIGPIIDQAALQGFLKKVRDMGMTLVSVCPVEPDQENVSDVKS